MEKYYCTYEGQQVKEEKYCDNQYEEYNGGIFKYKEQINARYIKQEEVDYQGNMLIEALPPVYSVEQIVKKLQKKPFYSELERGRSEEYRIEAITRLKNFISVFIKHIEIEKKLSTVIRRGYESKSIGTPQFIKEVNFTSSLIHDKWTKEKLNKLKCFFNESNSSMAGGSIIGISGGGKTTALNNILVSYPQCIVHTEYKGDKFLFKQIVWLKIDCTHNGSIKGICNKFFNEADEILGSNYLYKFANNRRSIDDMIVAMAHIVKIHALGVLVIDEIQHLASARSGADEVLNFLVTLENELKLPIIYIGTYKAVKKVLGKDFRQARRASGIGEIEWNNMKDDDEWNMFVSEMWRYQWTKEFTEITEELKKTLYINTMGITDRVVKLFMAVQMEAIISGEEKITNALINKVAKENMPLTFPMIEALRANNIGELIKYDDIRAINVDQLIDHAKENISLKKELEEVLQSNIYRVKLKRQEIEDSIIIMMCQLGFNQSEAKRLAEEIIKENGINNDLDFYLKQVGKFLKNSSNKMEEKSVDKIKTRKKISANNMDIYEEYKNKGKIKNPKDDFLEANEEKC